MPVTDVITDEEALTITVIADFTVSQQRLWDAYADPRQIERFWGPPTYPATFTRHDVHPGGISIYYMTSPEGDRHWAYWKWASVDAPHSFEVHDGFAHEGGTPNTEMPEGHMTFAFTETALGSRLTTTTHYGSLEDLEKVLAMGVIEGTSAAMGQIDAVLEDLASFAEGRGTELQRIGDTQARVSRVVRCKIAEVWRAMTEPDLLRQWQLGPDGWSMPVCDYGSEVDQNLRTEWRNDESGEQFGFVGVVKESAAPYRLVSTERMISPQDPDGAQSPETLNELSLVAVEGGTLVSYLITYPDAETREMVLATGMVDGMEHGYARLEAEVLGA